MHEISIRPSSFGEAELCLLDGRQVLLLEAPQNGKAKVKVVGGTEEVVVPVERLEFCPESDEAIRTTVEELKKRLMKKEVELEEFRRQRAAAANRREFRIRAVTAGNTALWNQVREFQVKLKECEEKIVRLRSDGCLLQKLDTEVKKKRAMSASDNDMSS